MSSPQALKTAYFRGVPFIATSHSVSIGRRLASHLFPQRDLGYQEDIGRQDRAFTLEGYLVGDDVEQRRDQLISALETPGAGELNHPWLGRLWVVAKPTDLQESRSERRKVALKLSFIEAEEPRAAAPTQSRLSDNAGRKAAADTLRTAGFEVLKGLNLRGAPAFVWAGAREGLTQLAGMLGAVRGLLPLSGIEGFIGVRSARALISDGDGFLGNPSEIGPLLSQSLGGMLATSVGMDARGRQRTPRLADTYRVIREFADYAAVLEAGQPTGSVSRWQNQINITQTLILDGGRLIMLAEAAQWLLPDLIDNAPSREGAFERARPLLTWSEREAMAAAARRDDRSWSAIDTLQQRIRSSAMARPNNLQVAQLAMMTPSLVAAHRFYGDANRWQEVADAFADPRQIVHPGFLNGAGRIPILQGA